MALILDKNKKVPFSYLDGQNEYEALRGMHISYINYHFDWCIKNICGFRVIDEEEAEVTYITVVPWTDSLCSRNRIFNLQDIKSQKIDIEEYYARHITKFGHTQY
jgi:hypothetical protein